MSRAVVELESILVQLVAEHRALLDLLNRQQQAMQAMDRAELEHLARQQETVRLKIASLDLRRRACATQVAMALRLGATPTISAIAAAVPQGRRLGDLGAELKQLVGEVASRAQIAGKLAGAVLGHLNTVLRLLAGAVQTGGVYTRDGTPRVSGRLGMLEAVG